MNYMAELTTREKEILELIAQNYTNAEISKILYLSTSTVKNEISSIMTKLGAYGRVNAVVIAIRSGII